MGSKDHGRKLTHTTFNPKGLPYDRGTLTTAGGGSIVLSERCDWCDARRELTPSKRLDRMAELSVDALNFALEDVPRRPNNCCPYHWSNIMKIREPEGLAAINALFGNKR